ncbi:AAA family ATPase [Streptomyces sp. NPDC093598]|uniref:AAA family ATPase n=1 Tax=Streptomyces sp. NPDC093598 TaxID=3366046 RepID=UPI00380A3583
MPETVLPEVPPAARRRAGAFVPLRDGAGPGPLLVLLIGPAGSGKSTAAAAWPEADVVTSGAVPGPAAWWPSPGTSCPRELHCLVTEVEGRLARGRTCVVDAALTEGADRARLLTVAERYGAPPVALVMGTPLGLCLERNAARPRHRRLPGDTVRAQYARTRDAVAGLRAEGFARIEILHGGSAHG